VPTDLLIHDQEGTVGCRSSNNPDRRLFKSEAIDEQKWYCTVTHTWDNKRDDLVLAQQIGWTEEEVEAAVEGLDESLLRRSKAEGQDLLSLMHQSVFSTNRWHVCTRGKTFQYTITPKPAGSIHANRPTTPLEEAGALTLLCLFERGCRDSNQDKYQ
jgi:hypothetical protein